MCDETMLNEAFDFNTFDQMMERIVGLGLTARSVVTGCLCDLRQMTSPLYSRIDVSTLLNRYLKSMDKNTL